MAAEKTTKRKQKTAGTVGAASESPSKRPRRAAPADDGSALRQHTHPRQERRFEPKTGAVALMSVIAMSIGAVLVGAGTYGQWMRGEELGPHKWAPYLLVGGAVLLMGVALIGQRGGGPIRVGDAGVGLEKDASDIERIEWRDVTGFLLGADALTVQGHGTSITLPLALHPQAAARVIAEAKARIPKHLEDIDASALPAVDDAAGEVLPLEAVQVAGARCKKTDKLIAFEKDARVCGRCGEIYHKDGVPPRCLSCDAKLKS